MLRKLVTPCVGVWIEMLQSTPPLIPGTSLPAWECGLKLLYIYSSRSPSFVTPCVGVWIEISIVSLKSSFTSVTPCVGVWIEIMTLEKFIENAEVTPCVGVWIEIPPLP